MAEDVPATDAGTPALHHPRHRKALSHKENPSTRPARPAPVKKSKTDIAIEQAAARLAAEAPPLSEGQKRRIAELFAPAVNAVKR
ncbi:hypothetical protein AB0M47_11385 [Hamadaea sp. NPDC051192]|uniref:hypothetical protein n=1 Tax=Hamadaea sp. NPDC051192 TaxID=3154940 RepID=UPI00342087AC